MYRGSRCAFALKTGSVMDSNAHAIFTFRKWSISLDKKAGSQYFHYCILTTVDYYLYNDSLNALFHVECKKYIGSCTKSKDVLISGNFFVRRLLKMTIENIFHVK